MQSDRLRWNARYRGADSSRVEAPDSFFLDALALVEQQPTHALDLAAGRGRHALELARRGWSVEAWDVSDEALHSISEQARIEGLMVATRRVDLSQALDLQHHGRFDLIIVVNFLDRALLARVHELLTARGTLIAVTYTTDRSGAHPADRWCLAPGELQGGLPGFDTLLEREVMGRAGWMGALQR